MTLKLKISRTNPVPGTLSSDTTPVFGWERPSVMSDKATQPFTAYLLIPQRTFHLRDIYVHLRLILHLISCMHSRIYFIRHASRDLQYPSSHWARFRGAPVSTLCSPYDAYCRGVNPPYSSFPPFPAQQTSPLLLAHLAGIERLIGDILLHISNLLVHLNPKNEGKFQG